MKLLKVLVAVLVIAAMAVPVIAEDRLQLSGEMRVRGYVYDTDYKDVPVFDTIPTGPLKDKLFFDEDGLPTVKEAEGRDDDGAWNDQRLRMLGKIAVAEGVSVIFRFDATESDEDSSNAVAWGGSKSSAYQYSQRRADIQFDNAYLMVEKNGFTLKAGQQYFGFWGYTGKMMDVIGAGFTGQYQGLTLMHLKRLDENSGNNTFASATGNEGDVSLTGLKYDFKGEGFSLTPMVSYNTDDHTTNYDLLGLGLAGSVELGPVLLKGEFNYFDGETDAYTFNVHGLPAFTLGQLGEVEADLEGMQLYLDASIAVTNNIRMGLMGFYAEGQDDAIQATSMNRDANVVWTFADYHPESYGTWAVEFVDEFYDIYDPAGTSGGVIAGQLYADIKASENTSLKLAGMYFQNEDDALAEYDGYTFNAGISYALTKNTTLSAHANYIKYSFDSLLDEEFELDVDTETLQMISGIQVKF